MERRAQRGRGEREGGKEEREKGLFCRCPPPSHSDQQKINVNCELQSERGKMERWGEIERRAQRGRGEREGEEERGKSLFLPMSTHVEGSFSL